MGGLPDNLDLGKVLLRWVQWWPLLYGFGAETKDGALWTWLGVRGLPWVRSAT